MKTVAYLLESFLELFRMNERLLSTSLEEKQERMTYYSNGITFWFVVLVIGLIVGVLIAWSKLQS